MTQVTRHRAIFVQPAISMLDHPDVQLVEPRRCGICDSLMPAGWWAADVHGTYCCTATCVQVHVAEIGVDDEDDVIPDIGININEPADCLRQARYLEHEADGLEDEANEKRDAAEALRRRAQAIEDAQKHTQLTRRSQHAPSVFESAGR